MSFAPYVVAAWVLYHNLGVNGVAEAANPAAVAECPVEGLAEREPGVLDGVVRAGLEVALHAHVEVEPAVAGQRVEQMVEEADTGVARPTAGAVE